MQRYIKTFGIWRPLTDIDVLERINIFPHFSGVQFFFNVFLTSQVTLARIPAVQVGCFWSETAVVVGKGPMNPPDIHLLDPMPEIGFALMHGIPRVCHNQNPNKKGIKSRQNPNID